MGQPQGRRDGRLAKRGVISNSVNQSRLAISVIPAKAGIQKAYGLVRLPKYRRFLTGIIISDAGYDRKRVLAKKEANTTRKSILLIVVLSFPGSYAGGADEVDPKGRRNVGAALAAALTP